MKARGSSPVMPTPVGPFTPAADFNGTVDFTYTITDGNGGELPVANSFQVFSVNDVPLFDENNAAAIADGTEDTVVTIAAADLLSGFSDPEQGQLTISGLSANGGAITSDGSGSYMLVALMLTSTAPSPSITPSPTPMVASPSPPNPLTSPLSTMLLSWLAVRTYN